MSDKIMSTELLATLDQLDQLERYRAALVLIATPARSDGTFNRCRKACQKLAYNALYPPDAGWQNFGEDFDYEKEYYEVKTKDGEIISAIWPNAGVMNSTDGSGRLWTHKDGVQVRLGMLRQIGD